MSRVTARLGPEATTRRDAEAVLAMAAERDVGVMAIKAAAARPWANGQRHATTWYEPWTEPSDVERSVRFTLSVPGVHAICTPGDVHLLERVLAVAASFAPMDDDDRHEASATVAEEALIFPMPTA